MTKQETINRQGQKCIAGWKATVAHLWRKCCEYDSIAPESQFVVFSEGNPYSKFYDIAVRNLTEAREQYRVGGYVGLTIKQGRAK